MKMKPLGVFALMLTVIGTVLAASPLDGGDALRGEFPISLRFRSEAEDGGSEAEPPADVLAAYATETSGALNKMIRDIGRHDPDNAQAIARALPNKLMLAHLLFPSVNTGIAQHFGGRLPFSPCHFAYYTGCRATETVGPIETRIEVADGTKFRTGDVVLLVPVRAGQKLWESSEWAAVTAVRNNRLTLQRGVYGTEPVDPQHVPHDFLWVAPGTLPFREDPRDKTQFEYNWSTLCPRDERGRQASNALGEMIAALFAPGGPLDSIRGLAWDVPTVRFASGDGDRLVDADMDGVGDNGYQNGVNTYALGAYEVHRNVRAALGEERIFLSDGFYGDAEDPRLQLPAFFNGVEHDINNDHTLHEVSSLLNVFTFYQQHVTRPQFNLLVRKDGNAAPGRTAPQLRQNQLMKNAFATILGVVFNDLSFARAEPGKAFSAADEIRAGKENKLYWLGKPIGPVLRPALRAPDLLDGAGVNVTDAFLSRWKTADCAVERQGNLMVVREQSAPGDDTMTMILPDVPVRTGQGLLVQFEVRSDKLAHFPADVPRSIAVTPEGFPGWRGRQKQLRSLLAWSSSQDFTPVSFYFREPTRNGRVNLRLQFQGRGNVFVRNFTLREGTEVFAREFEHGVVLCNPNQSTPFLFDLNELFPGARLRRIDGSAYDEHMTRTNDGTPAGDQLTLEPQSGLFLIKRAP